MSPETDLIPRLENAPDKVHNLLDPQTLERKRLALEQHLEENPDIREFGRLYEEINYLTTQFYAELPGEKALEIDNQIKAKREEQSELPVEAKVGHARIIEKQRALDKGNRLIFIDEEEALELTQLLDKVKEQAHPIENAPFMDHGQNSTDAWKVVPNEAVSDFLKSKTFFNTHGLSQDKNHVDLLAVQGTSIDVPLNLLVDAAGFDSWHGRDHGDGDKSWNSREYGHQKTNSINVIKHYAALPTELPPVDHINIYVQPDGKMFADNSEGDSHRLGAAILRGDESVKTNGISIYALPENIL